MCYKKTGLDILMHAVAHHEDKTSVHGRGHHKGGPEGRHHRQKRKECRRYPVIYSDLIEDKIGEITGFLNRRYKGLKNPRWYAIKYLEMDELVVKEYPVDISEIVDRSYEEDIINEKYKFIEATVEEVLFNRDEQIAFTDRIDRIVTHKYLGLPIFLGIMAIVFFLTFQIGDMIKDVFEGGLETFSIYSHDLLLSIGAGEVITSLIVDGIIIGVGGILTFLPNIAILF